MAKDTFLAAENPAVDLAVVSEMVRELEDYIIKDDLYRTLIVSTPSGDQSLQMTGGSLLARLHRLQGRRSELSAAQQAQLDTLQSQADQTIYSLRTRFHERLQREMKARLDTLKWFLDESSEDRQRFKTNFPFEMRNRQHIEEILKQIKDEVAPELKQRLQGVDHRIRMLAFPGPFAWDEKLKDVYPQVPYWYLYLRP